jgi:hypothetical protein
MRFLIFPFMMFLLSFAVLRTSGVWSTKKNWKRIALEAGVAFGASLLTLVIVGFIIVVFN